MEELLVVIRYLVLYLEAVAISIFHQIAMKTTILILILEFLFNLLSHQNQLNHSDSWQAITISQ